MTVWEKMLSVHKLTIPFVFSITVI